MKNRILSLLLALALALSLVPTALAAESDGVRVAVIDTGVSTKSVSPDSILTGKNYILPDEDTEDKLGHGTAVSAIIVGSETARVAGVCPEAKLVPLVTASKDKNGAAVQGDTALTAQAIRDAIDVYGCRIINISAGAKSDSFQLRSAVAYAQKRGALVISSAGNNQQTDPGVIFYPGGYDSVLCVGAANSDGSIASFSQQNDTVDLLALGSMRVATIKGTRINAMGTSYSTAIVTGAAAKIWSTYPDLTADEVRAAVLSCTREVKGWRVLDLEAAAEWTPFTDVKAGDYFYEPVRWAVGQGITNGVSATTFGPAQTCSQAHILTFLWRAAGSPVPSGTNRYTNGGVKAGEYFYEAFLWAWEKGVVMDRTLDPKAPCSRSDVVTYLWRLAGSPAAGAASFADVPSGAPYAGAVSWAVEQGITDGTGNGKFSPNKTCTRGQIVTFLYRAIAEKG